ncbi:MAG: hypothetical protein Q9159_007574, partial [Coniocarpon cinnabarinum]
MDYTDGERKDHAMENAPESPTTEMSLRDHLLAASQASQQASQSPPNTQQPHQAPATSRPQQSTSTEGTSSPSPINHVSSSRAANSSHMMQLDGPSSHPSTTHSPPPHSHSHSISRTHTQSQSQLQPHTSSAQSLPQHASLDPQIAASTSYGYPPHPTSGFSPAQHNPHAISHVSNPQQAALAAMSPSSTAESHLGSGGETASDKAKRELSSSKRAAQNRAAQRAFRQRKESYIKKLEDDVRNASALPALQENLQRVQQENFHMRDYIMALQSRLLDLTGEFPPPPSTLELRDPRSGAPIS